MTALQVAVYTGGRVLGEGDGEVELSGFAPACTAIAGDLTFAENADYLAQAERSAASAILVSDASITSGKVLILVRCTRTAMARILPYFSPENLFVPGIHPGAVVDDTAVIASDSYVGPHCVVGRGAFIGARSVLMGGNHMGDGARLGEDVRLFPNVVVGARCEIGDRVVIHAGTVIGSDGYGYVLDQGRHRKIPQMGNVVIGEDVEIGSNASIDRAAFGSTRIGPGTKVDNLVHVAHNVEIGNHCLVMGQSGFAGSTRVGNYCVVAAQSGIAGHLSLGNQSVVGAKSGVMRDVPDGGRVLGIPALPEIRTKRQWLALQRLPDVLIRLRALEAEVARLTAAVSQE